MAELTVASTTDTQNAINMAAGVEQIEEPKQVVTEPEPTEPVKAEEEEKPEKPSKSASQRRFDAMTRRMKEMEAELQTLRQPKQEPVQEVKEEPEYQLPPRPRQDDKDAKGQPKYSTYEEYEEAVMDWKLDQREMVTRQRAAEQAAAEAQQRIQDSYNEQVAAVKEKYPDFDQAIARAPQIYTAVGQALMEMENGAEITYYLATHRDIIQKLNEMGPMRAVAEVGRIAVELGTNIDQAEEVDAEAEGEPEEKPVHKASPPPRRASSAPPPIKPVGGSATKSSVPLDDLPYSEFRRIRDQQVKNRYRR